MEKFTNKQKGVALYLSIVLLSIVSAALLVLLSISLSQTKVIWTINDSIFAFYAADSGIEQALYKVFKDLWDPASIPPGTIIFPDPSLPDPDPGNPGWQPFSSGSMYQVKLENDVPAIISSTGQYNGTLRKIEINLD